MTRPDYREVATIQRGYLGAVQPLGEADHGGVGGAERKIGVLVNKVRHAGEVAHG